MDQAESKAILAQAMADIDQLGLLIDGEIVAGATVSDVTNPSTGEVLCNAPSGDALQLEQACAAAKRAASKWAEDEAGRRAALGSMAKALTDQRDRIAAVLALEIGLPFSVACDEVSMASGFFAYRARQNSKPDVLQDSDRQHVEVVRRPIGVVGAIIPWNAPVMIVSEKVSTAMAAGNTVVVKPSPMAPLTLMLLGQIFNEVLPAGVLNIVTGDDALGRALVAHPDVGMISFTGSIKAGQSIMSSAGAGLKRLSLELGGNDAAIVLPGTNLAAIAQKIFFAAFYRSGQICAAIKRLYVHESQYDEMLAALAGIAGAVKIGGAFDPGSIIGPLSNRQQFEIVDKIVRETLAAGGIAVAGGKPLERPGYFYAPTIVGNVNETHALVAKEQFGPALPVLSYSDLDAAVEAANDTQCGLGGSIWCDDVEAGEAIARRLQSGSAWVNRHGIVMPDTPFGGMKMSGLGRANGDVGLDNFCELQTISIAKPRK